MLLFNDKNLDWLNLKEFAHDKMNMAQMMISVFNKIETLWEREKMLVTSISFFSHNVF